MVQLVGAPSHTPKGCGFDFYSGHIPRLQVQSLVGACTGGNRLIFLSQKSVNISSDEDLKSLCNNFKFGSKLK